MRRLLTAFIIGTAALAVLGACHHEFEPPDREERVADAEARFAAVQFDTITWESDDARALEGNSVYAARCRNCHGPLGAGGTAYAQERDLDVPSLIVPDWRFAAHSDSVRHRVFVGHAAGMPNWGVGALTAREIDAVSFYVMAQLRPDAGSGGG